MKQIFFIGDRVHLGIMAKPGTVMYAEPDAYTVKMDGERNFVFASNNTLAHAPLAFAVRPGDGIVDDKGRRGSVTSALYVGAHCEFTIDPTDNANTVVGARIQFDDGTNEDLVSGHFTRESFFAFLFLRKGRFGKWRGKASGYLRYAAFVAFMLLGLLMDFDRAWYGYALAIFGAAVTVIMTWGHWRNYNGKQA